MKCQICGRYVTGYRVFCDVATCKATYKRTAGLLDDVFRLRAAIETVLADAESQHPGGWGPDVTMVGLLKEALNGNGRGH